MSSFPAFRLTVAVASLAALISSAKAETGFQQDPGTFPISLAGSYLAGRSADNASDLAAAAEYFTAALSDDPENPILLERVLLLRIANGDIKPGIGYADRLIDLDQRNPVARLLLGVRDLQQGDFVKAKTGLAESAQAPLAVLTSGLLSAWAEQGSGKIDDALATIDALEGPTWYGIFKSYHTALIDDLAGREDAAVAAIRDAYQTDGAALRIVDAYGRILTRAGHRDEAIDAMKKFLEAQPDNPVIGPLLKSLESGEEPGPTVDSTIDGASEVLYGLGAAIGTNDGMELPAAYLQLALYLAPQSNLALMALGDVLVTAGRCEDAIDIYGRIPEASGLRRTADIQSSICLDSLDRTDEATKTLTKLIDANPADIDAVVALGNIYRGRERFAEAAQVYTRGIDTIAKPTAADWRLFYFRGVASERSKNWDQAEADLKKALELNPDQPQVLNYLGYSWVDMGRNLDEGLNMIRSAVDQRPNDGYIVDSLGWAYYRLGRYDEAVTQLERAVELKPEDSVINDHLGDAYWKVGRKLEATFQWSHARDLDPEPVNLDKIVKKLENGLTDAGKDG
jgi:tetratricopeptide (TPR) repeat protein